METLEVIFKYEDDTMHNETIKTTELGGGLGKISTRLEKCPKNFKIFYGTTDGYKSFWETEKIIDSGQKIYGRINILPCEKVLNDWKGVVYFDKNPEDEMDKFKIVDFFIDEACVGYFHDENKVDLMEYYTFQDEPITLSVNFAGYIELMFEARGFLNWQKILLHLNGEENNTAYLTRFKKYMPQLFPDFKWEKFMAIYDRVRIK